MSLWKKTGIALTGLYLAGCMASWIHTYENEIKPLEQQFAARVNEITPAQYDQTQGKDPILAEIIEQRKEAVKGEALDLSDWMIKKPTNNSVSSEVNTFHLHYNPFGFLF